ncbi:C2H2-type zinc finger protein [Esox lucius]|uniref:Transcription factor E4F1 n=1 Tax=Esox lucius TaxID=8010 RepID=A0A3P8Z1X0_ESOLU|nr:C2H2-type zinc finger protein [Esox lucius]
MESECSETNSAAGLSCTGLPVPSLRLLVPPLQLMSASIWQVFQRRDVTSYAMLAEFVCLVTEMVPELLIYRHRAQLILGLQARHILELCRGERPVDPQVILTQLHKIQPFIPSSNDAGDMEVESSGTNFLELVQTLLKDVDQRETFFKDIFPVEFGPQYDLELQTLMWEFLSRLVQLLPTPDLEQTIEWLGSATSVLDDCARVVSHPMDLKCLLQHHKRLGYLEQHVPHCAMGDYILSSLSISPHSRTVLDTEKTTCCQSEPSQEFRETASLVSSVDDLEVEVVTLTEYAEVELGSSLEVVELCDGNNEEGQIVLHKDKKPEETPTEEEVGGTKSAMQEQDGVLESNSDLGEAEVDVKSSRQSIPSVAHNCSVCEKSFKFASALIAHQVIHTGERPYVCNLCGRCFSFRQSLERHKHTHKDGRIYNCLICGETFQSLSARTEHKKSHTEHGAYQCTQCSRTFSWESAMVRHLKSHTQPAEIRPQEPTRSFKLEQEDVENQEVVGKVAVNTPETDPTFEDEGKSHHSPQEGRSRGGASSSSEPSVSGLLDEVRSPVQVRTSGRKSKPTLKVQMVNLQKRKGKVTTPKRTGTLINPKCSKPLAFKSEEHSYGFPTVSTEEGDTGLSAGSSSPVFSGPKCSFVASDAVHVQPHTETVHSGERQEDSKSAQHQTGPAGLYDCPDCDNSFKFQSLLKYHQRVHTGERPFVCSHCGRRFSFKQSLERHKQTHKDGRKYECPICGQSFKCLSAHVEHTKSHMENGVYRCSECGRTFAWKSALVRHLRIHTENAAVTERSHKCPRCDLAFSSGTYLSRHLLTHQEERSHVCSCGKAFAYKTALTAHQRTHLKERPHQCKQCGKGFLYKGGLVSHMKIHSDEMPFMCSFCGKSFKRERNMKKHECCHTRENLYSCSQCDKTFVYKATLTRHELTHSGERPFLCADCGKGFFSHAELLKHERFHTGHKPFQCPYCGKKFTQSCYLTIHLRYHTGLRPYSCTYCDKCFLSANRLKRHTRTHTGEKPYLCSECGKGFKQSYHLKMHQRTHATKIC